MADYLLSLKSQRSSFTFGFAAEYDEAAIDQAKALVVKARAPVGATVTIIRPDTTTMDVRERLAAFLDRPDL